MIQIEADISDGLPTFSLVGYLSSEVKEARERVRIALKNSGYRFPPRRVTVNLSPADIRKDGTGYDLAIAVSVLVAYGYIPEQLISEIIFIGELSLKGEVKPVSGVLPMVYTGLEHGMKYCVLPVENGEEASVVEGIRVIGVTNLKQVTELLSSQNLESALFTRRTKKADGQAASLDFCDVRGQECAKRAAEVAAAGMHNLLLIGPPGSGKSMIAGRMSTIMPSMTFEEQMEISRIYSVAGLLSAETPLVTARPFRSPHHTITQVALVGGGKVPRPGEVSLASGGVLFLDELPEFERSSIEVLRQPLEEGWVNVSRLNGNCRYPAHTLLMAAMNPCKCGWYPDRSRCRCSLGQVQKYLGKISQPMLDRIDICTETVPVEYQELSGEKDTKAETSAEIRERVERAQQIQFKRYAGENFCHNANLPAGKLEQYCILSTEAQSYLELVFQKMEFSARAYHKILKVGRTIADLQESPVIEKSHIAEAVCYRSIDRRYWGGMGE
jgi:magnesium chelatase family protein